MDYLSVNSSFFFIFQSKRKMILAGRVIFAYSRLPMHSFTLAATRLGCYGVEMLQAEEGAEDRLWDE